MPRQDHHAWRDGDGARSPDGLVSCFLAGIAYALSAESDRWFLWLPVFFACGILSYFALSSEPSPTLPIALLLGAVGIALVLKNAPLGLAIAGTLLAMASG